MTKTPFDQNDIMTDYSGFKWMSFIPGKSALEDVSVMEIATTQARFSRFILPDQYFTPTYCIQIVKGGSLHININNTNYELTANQGCLVTPELLIEKPQSLENYVEMLVLSVSREFIQELNLEFPLAATAFIYVHPVWNISPKRMERLEQYFHLMREVLDDKDRKAALHLVLSFFYYLAEPELNHFPQQNISTMYHRPLYAVGGRALRATPQPRLVRRPTVPHHALCGEHGQTDSRHDCKRLYRARYPPTGANTPLYHYPICSGNSRPARFPEPVPFRHVLQAPHRPLTGCLQKEERISCISNKYTDKQ